MSASLRPAEVCRLLLATLEASEGRRRRRKRDTTPDATGLAIKRGLIERVVADDPDPERFETWLLERCLDARSEGGDGSLRAMAMELRAEWRLALGSPGFGDWLTRGAPSDDK